MRRVVAKPFLLPSSFLGARRFESVFRSAAPEYSEKGLHLGNRRNVIKTVVFILMGYNGYSFVTTFYGGLMTNVRPAEKVAAAEANAAAFVAKTVE